MKKIILLVISALLFIPYSCKDEENDGSCNGAPEVWKIKKTVLDESELADPAAFGDWLIIEGANFCDVQEILINDVEVNLYDVYIESGMISLAIPRKIPTEETKTITIITSKGKVEVPLDVVVPQFVLEGLFCEYVLPGDTAFLSGNNFDLYNIDTTSTVIKIGDSLMAVNYVDAKNAFFRIPRTAQLGDQMTLINKDTLGNVVLERKVPGLLNDFSNIVFGFRDTDHHEQSTFRDFEITDGVGKVGYPSPINRETGKYGVIKGDALEWNWDQYLVERNGVWPWWGDASITNPDILIGPAENSMIKLEFNVVNDWASNTFIISLFNEFEYRYEPWKEQGSAYKTYGWRTLRIPLTEFKRGDGTPIKEVTWWDDNASEGIVPLGHWKYTRIFFNGTGHRNVFICWDNFRCVPQD
jgi:hypothetical protein